MKTQATQHETSLSEKSTTVPLASILRALCLVLGVSSSGCATLFSSTSQTITVTANVEGAKVLLNGRPRGRTPLTFELDRDTFKKPRITVVYPGYRSEQFPISKTLNKVALFNCTSVLSWGTDALTGALIEYSPDAYYVELRPEGEDTAEHARRWQASWFVITNRRRLTVDIARGDGEYLRALAALHELSGASSSYFGGSSPWHYRRC